MLWRKCSYIIKAGKLFDLLNWFLVSVTSPGFSGHSFPEGYRLSFPTRTNYMYAVVTHSMPKLRAFTICLWLRPAERGIGTPVSYAVPEQPNELVLLQGLHAPAELLINDKVLRVSDSVGSEYLFHNFSVVLWIFKGASQPFFKWFFSSIQFYLSCAKSDNSHPNVLYLVKTLQ